MGEPGLSMEFQDHTSDSDLSEIREPVQNNISPTPSPAPSEIAEEDEPNSTAVEDEDDDMEQAEESSEDNASDDEDFNEDVAVAEESEISEPDTRSGSHDSAPVGKRKAASREDAYIKANPELYGLRRSVCHFYISS
jgi:chromodomain-helicase-DNA-binding protein 1